jgi:hypothetical protein
MPEIRNPSLREINSDVASTVGRATASAFKNPSLSDMGMNEPKKKLDVDFSGAKLNIAGIDTGVDLSPEAFQALAGAGKSFNDLGLSARQIFDNANFSKRQQGSKLSREIADTRANDEALMDTGWGTAGNIAGDVALSAVIPVGGLSRAAGAGILKAGAPRLGTKVAQSLLTDAALAGAVQSQFKPTLEDESRLTNAGVGALGGGLGYAVTKPIVSAVGKGINTLRNKWGSASAQELDELASRYGVDLSVGDLTRSPGWQAFEDASRDVPFSGRRDIMERQTGQIQDLLYSLRENVRPSLDLTDDVGNVVHQYATPEDMMVGEIQRNYGNLVKQKDKLFENVGDVIAANPQAKPVVFEATKSEIRNMLDSHPQIFDQFRDVDSRLMNTLSGLDNNLSQAQGVLNAQGQPFQRTAQGTYTEAQWLRKRLGSLAEAARKQSMSGAITDDAAGQIKQLYKAVNKDLDTWGSRPGNADVHKAYKTAQKYYNENIVPFKKHPVLKKVVNEHVPYDADVAAREFFKQDRGNLARDIMKFQTPEGQKASQFVILEDMIDRGLNKNKESGLDIQAFLNRSGQLDMPAKHVLEPDVRKQMSDVEDILRAAKRSAGYLDSGGNTGRWAAVQATRSLAPWVAGSGAMAAGASAGAGLATAGGLAGLVAGTNLLNKAGSSPAGKRILMSSPKLPGALQRIADTVTTRVGGPAAVNWSQGAGIPIPQFIDDPRFYLEDPAMRQ